MSSDGGSSSDDTWDDPVVAWYPARTRRQAKSQRLANKHAGPLVPKNQQPTINASIPPVDIPAPDLSLPNVETSPPPIASRNSPLEGQQPQLLVLDHNPHNSLGD